MRIDRVNHEVTVRGGIGLESSILTIVVAMIDPSPNLSLVRERVDSLLEMEALLREAQFSFPCSGPFVAGSWCGKCWACRTRALCDRLDAAAKGTRKW
jgi:hypothetical protein